MADKKISQLTGATTPLGGTEELPLVQSGVTKKVTVANLTVGREIGATRFSATPITLTETVFNRTTNNGGTLFVGRENSAGSAFGAEAYSSLIYSQGDYPLNIYVDSQKSVQMKGSTGNWDVALLKGNLVIGTAGKGIDFSADPSAAGMTSELLDDYEEGTWTPVVSPASGSLTSYTSNGTYTKTGRMVFIDGTFTITNAGTASGVASFSGLPFIVGDLMTISGVVRETGVTGGIFFVYAPSGNTIGNISTSTFGGITWTNSYVYSFSLVYRV